MIQGVLFRHSCCEVSSCCHQRCKRNMAGGRYNGSRGVYIYLHFGTVGTKGISSHRLQYTRRSE